MGKALAVRGNQGYSFERWPDEDEQEYVLFKQYCETAGPVTPYEFLSSIGQSMEMIDRATLHSWIQRRDSYQNWLDKQRRQMALQVVDKYLCILAGRLPYLQQREQFAKEREMLNGKDPNSATKPALRRVYSQAMRDTHETIHELLRVAKALEPNSGINISNIVANASPEAKRSIEEMAKAFGDPLVIEQQQG